MYDLEKEFKNFYYNEVVLPKEEVNNLREKKKLNIDRLKEGLEDYNEENNTNYKMAETVEQGSVVMSTVTQNENNDYDIDIAIVFDEINIGKDMGARAIKNVIVNSLKKKCTNFKKDPEVKTNCVRIEYADNYHVDFAIYKRIKNSDETYSYEHAGSEWRPRNPRAINNWFRDEIATKGEKLRQVIRLSKMFCKSRTDWNMPGGLIQSVLCDEKIQKYERLDEVFYYTMREIKNRLSYNKNIYNPTDATQSLILTLEQEIKVENLHTRLDTYTNKLNVLFNSDCTKEKALDAWYDFFNHDFWKEQKEAKGLLLQETYSRYRNWFDDTEELINNMFSVIPSHYFVSIDCNLKKSNSNEKLKLSNLLENNRKVLIGYNLEFYISNTNIVEPYEIYWKVKNEGEIAEKDNCIRGQIFKGTQLQNETSDFEGDHYVECYIIKDGYCVARKRIAVPIR